MNIESEKKFKTKTGYCHILEDRILLTRNGVVGSISQITMGNNIARPLMLYGFLAITFLALAYKKFTEQHPPEATLFFVLGFLLVLVIKKSWNNSGTPIIERKKIEKVEFKKALPGATRAYFVIYFEVNGQIKKRLIILPGSLSNGSIETEIALTIMRSEFPYLRMVD
jgi:hypothetical protein